MDSKNSYSLNDKVIIVTGGTGILGNSFVNGIVEAGGTVCILGRNSILAKERAEHKANHCSRRDIMCRIQGCAKVLCYADLETHERLKCRFRLVPCSQGCGEFISAIRLGKHLASLCPSRYVPCPQNCGITLRFSLMKNHVEVDCVRRPNMAKIASVRHSIDD